MLTHEDGWNHAREHLCEVVAGWMVKNGFATGDGSSVETLLVKLERQLKERFAQIRKDAFAECNAISSELGNEQHHTAEERFGSRMVGAMIRHRIAAMETGSSAG